MKKRVTRHVASEPAERADVTIEQPISETQSFLIGSNNRSYRHQYSNIYFMRLKNLRPLVEKSAMATWGNRESQPRLVRRVLDVVKSELCYVVGTVYIDMPMKPNVMVDIARDHSIPPPPPPRKYYSPDDNVMLEDESGRIKLVGNKLATAHLVTGVITGVLGRETGNGSFEVEDICFAGMSEFPSDVDTARSALNVAEGDRSDTEWIALVSGLRIGDDNKKELLVQLLSEYLIGEQVGDQLAPNISRLIIVGNSLEQIPVTVDEAPPDIQRMGKHANEAISFSPHPAITLAGYLYDIGQVMPVHILPGESDPAGSLLPQQPFPRALFGSVSGFSSFQCETNPTYMHFTCDAAQSMNRRLLLTSGQPLNDMFKYLPVPPHSRLAIAEATLHWRHMAPTAPDTLWCHPYFSSDPFILRDVPDVYIIGGQDKFATTIAVDPVDEDATRCRIILVPDFSLTGSIALLNLQTLGVRKVDLRSQLGQRRV